MTPAEFASGYNSLLNDCIDFFTDKMRTEHQAFDFSAWDNDDEPKENAQNKQFGSNSANAQAETSSETNVLSKEKTPPQTKGNTLAMIEAGRKILKCQECALHKNSAARFPGCGSVASRIFLIAEPVTPMEERERYALSGAARTFFDKWLTPIGLSEDDLFVTNILKCCLGNSRLSTEMIDICRKHLDTQIELVNPQIIVTLGQIPISSLKRAKIDLITEHGTIINYNKRPVFPLFSPTFVLANPSFKAPLWEDLKKLKAILGNS